MTLSYPSHIPLARTPTPLDRAQRFALPGATELLFKRDDLTGISLSGNKVRKLEFLLAEAQVKKANTILTCGGKQSNHCRATAVAAAQLGMQSVLFLRVVDPHSPPLVEGNILLDRLVGAEIRWISHNQYAHRNELMAHAAEAIYRQDRVPYVIPEGGSTALGCWGYIRALEELAGQLPPGPATIVYAAGSGGTGAGLILGAKLLGRQDLRIVGINVCDNRDYFVRVITGLCEEAIRRFGLTLSVAPSDVEIIDGYVGRGYAQSRPEELLLLGKLARTEGILLDPVYTGKAFFGLMTELEKDPKRFGPRVVFLHTGGLFGLFGLSKELIEALAPTSPSVPPKGRPSKNA